MGKPITAEVLRYRGYDRILVTIPFLKACKTVFDFTGYNENDPNNSLNRIIELNAFNMLELKDNEVEMSDELTALYKRMFGRRKTDIETIPFANKNVALPFQVEGIKYLDGKRGNALLADEMGLGKTIQVIGYLLCKDSPDFRTIIMCPANLKLNWLDEFEKFWRTDIVEVLYGMKTHSIPKKKRIVIVNHQLLKTWTPSLCEFQPSQVVIDEAHDFVNHGAATHKFAEVLCETAGKTILLTGTPLINDTEDLWGLLSLVNPLILGGFTRYIHRFCPIAEYRAFKKKQFIRGKTWGRRIFMSEPEPDISEADKKTLHRVLVSTCMLRRLKKDVAPQLPKQIRKVIRIEIDDKTFWKAERELRKDIKSKLLASGSAKKIEGVDLSYARMRRLVGEAKFDFMCEWIDTFLAESKEKLVVVGWHRSLMEKLHERYEKQSYLVTGAIDAKAKHEINKLFQSEKGKRILIGNAKSIGTGINLTAASVMLFFELPMTGAMLSQIEARIHRLCQKALSLLYVYFVIKDTLEEKGIEQISDKQGTSNSVVDGVEAETLRDVIDDTMSMDLLRKLLVDKR